MDGITVVGAALTVWQAAETVIRIGEELVEKYKAFKYAKGRIGDLILRVESIWVKTLLQMKIIRDISKTLSDRLLNFQQACFERLNIQLQTALLKLAAISGQNLVAGIDLNKVSTDAKFSTKFRFTFLEKHLEQVVSDLESWHSTFDPSWLLLTRVQNDDVDTLVGSLDDRGQVGTVTVVKQIRQLVRKPQDTRREQASVFVSSGLVAETRDPIQHTDLKLSTLKQNGDQVLLDTTIYPEGTDPTQAKTFVRSLAKLLSTSGISDLNLLRCLGIILLHSSTHEQYQYVFAIPLDQHGSSPTSLRTMLSSPSPSLDAKCRLAKSLAKALTSIHAAEFVHKNIRPETIIVLKDERGERSVPYLVGFENLRPSTAHSALASDMRWERNIYRHPQRQGIVSQEYYVMQHDIYSLGVCLLEIGIWSSFLQYARNHDIQPGASLPISKFLENRNHRESAKEIKNLLVSMAERQLPSKMGHTYTKVVVSSLTCLDQVTGNVFDDKDFYDKDGIAIGVAFIEHILMKLDSISI